MHRVTVWYDADGNPLQVAVACMDSVWEIHAEATLQVGPFQPLDERQAEATDICHGLGGWRAHQIELELS